MLVRILIFITVPHHVAVSFKFLALHKNLNKNHIFAKIPWYVPVVPATWHSEAGESLKPRGLEPDG